MAATGICALRLLYAAKRALKTSVVSKTRVQPSWFDTRYKFGFGAGRRSTPSANVKAQLEGTVNVTSCEQFCCERKQRTRRLTTSERERDKIAGTKLTERKVQFEAVEDRNSWVKFGIDERAQVYTT